MPVETLAEALPYVNWITLVSLAVGAFYFAATAGWVTDATSGYLRFTAVAAAILGALAFASDGALPQPTALAIRPASAELDTLRRLALGAFAISAFAYAVLLGHRPLRLALGGAAAATAAVTLGAAAVGWAPTIVDAVPLYVQFGTLSSVAGGALAAIALGHWYLVTPKLSERPLLLQSRMLLTALVVQALLFVVWGTLGGGVDQEPWEALTGSSALLAWLRGIITVVFPVVLVYMALRTAQTRSMESATGLLYIALAAVLAGTIGAAALYVSNGILI
ncbi:MAG: hypothetical protein ACR2H0_04915 [Candidatus Limnocylindrales bacterium]